MPHGSRIALLSALFLTGCHTPERQPNPLVPPKPVVSPPTNDPVRRPTSSSAAPAATPTANSGRQPAYSPVVTNENFQRPIAETPPQRGITPAMGVPSLPSTSYPSAPPSHEIAPMTPPGMSGAAVPPTADTGDLKMPPMFGSK